MKNETAIKTQALQIMQKCPHFGRCSAPFCPLDPDQDERDYGKDESKCNLSKKKRYAIGIGSDLPRKGLTKMEWAAQQRWNGLDETEKQRRQAKLRGLGLDYTGDFEQSGSGCIAEPSGPKTSDK